MKLLHALLEKLTFQRMLVYSFSLLATFMVLCVGGWSVYTVSRHAVANIEHTVEQSANYINQSASILFSDAVSSVSLSRSYSISQFLNLTPPVRAYPSARRMEALFSDWRLVQQPDSPIVDLSVISVNNYGYSERNGYFRIPPGYMAHPQFHALAQEPRRIHIWGAPERLSERDWEKDVVCLATGIFKTGTNELTGIWRVSLRRSYLTDVLVSSRIADGGHVLILDRFGTPIFSDEPSVLLSPEQTARILSADTGDGTFSDKLQGEQSLISFRALQEMDWFIVSTVPEQQLLQPMRIVSVSIVISLLITIVLVFVVNSFISRGLSRPLIELTRHMQRAAAGNLDSITPVGGGREIQFLSLTFNQMLVDIKALMARIVEEQQNLQRSELKALQAQINPHFLYNSMDSAVWAAESGNSGEVIDLLISLSNFYKLTLSGGIDIVPFSLELRHVTCYLEVLHMRYNDLFDYTFQIGSGVQDAQFPKIILQPIVENAIYHGIKEYRYPAGEKGQLLIHAWGQDGLLCIDVCDNGAGMDADTLASLREHIASDQIQPDACYGLQNVNQRLRLFFGREHSLNITAGPMQGCTVHIRVPLRREGEESIQ